MNAKDFLTILRATCARVEKCSGCMFGVFCGENPRDMTEMAMDSIILIAEQQAERLRLMKIDQRCKQVHRFEECGDSDKSV